MEYADAYLLSDQVVGSHAVVVSTAKTVHNTSPFHTCLVYLYYDSYRFSVNLVSHGLIIDTSEKSNKKQTTDQKHVFGQ